jgi:putative ABC transport system permease protein
MLAISIGLILAMLVARSSVEAKIEEVKATTATQVTISPAGVMGAMGGGDPLTADQVAKIKATTHVASISSTLTGQLSTNNTSLQSALEMGRLRLGTQNNTDGSSDTVSGPSEEAMKPPIIATGTTNPSATIAEDKLTSGSMIDGNSTDRVALVGKTLAEKNNLSVGSTFTAYGQTITVKGIYSTDNRFQDSNLVMPLATLQEISSQSGAVSAVAVTVDSSDNVASTVSSLKSTLGSAADITSQQEQAEASVAPLQSIADLALGGVIAATIAGAVIILLTMVMIVRERRKEIGVVKAIGGSNRSIVLQFIAEALTLTVVGSIIGFAIGIAASGPMTQSLVSNQTSESSSTGRPSGPQRGAGPAVMIERAGGQLQNNVTSVTSTVTPQTFALGAGIVALIAVIGSALPAWFIAKIRPAEVLRTE